MLERIQLVVRKLVAALIESHTTGPILLAVIVGVGAGFGAVVFRMLIASANSLFFGGVHSIFYFFGKYYVILVPAAGGLIVGPLIYYFAREAKGHGVPEVMQAVALRGGRIRPRVAIVKSLASAICIGSGGSAGREGPIVQIGSTIGSTLGQLLRLPDQRVRMLVASGAAGGISATFNAPIAGVIFALEVILSEFSARAFGLVVLASVSANIISRTFLGNQPAFAIPPHTLKSSAEMPLYFVLGILAAVVAVVFVKTLYKIEDLWDGWRISEVFKPVTGGLLIGAVGVWLPQVFGVGYGPMEQALGGKLLLSTMLILVFMKILATSVTIGSGGSGGVFAPSLFIGAMLGGTFGLGVNHLFPNISAPSGAYALVGMAAVFAGAAHAPITAILILFEMTNDYRIILPLMTAVVTSTLISQLISRDSIYTLKLRRRGIDVHARQRINLMETILVSEAMTKDFETVRDTLPVAALVEEFTRTGHHGFPVLDANGNLVGMVTLSDIEEVVVDEETDVLVEDIMTKTLLVAYPDETLEDALRRFGSRDVGRLPVVERADRRKIVGLLRRGDIITAYAQASLKHAEVLAKVERMKLETGPKIKFISLDIGPDSKSVGKPVKDLELPKESILVSIRRDGRVLIPHGETIIKPGDRVVALAKRSDENELRESLT
ncbi:MAG TPA: chloride channel protein [Armatimonadota bacterium]|nr:chloride channel protein [Armatimonadota bacterium]